MEKNLLFETEVLTQKNFDLALTKEEIMQFEKQGYLGPYTFFSAEEAKAVSKRFFSFPNILLPWIKGRHEVVKEFAKTAKHPFIVEKVVSLIGEDVLLWGSIIIKQKSGGKHPMHVDMEHTVWDGISIWMGLENVVSGKCFSIVPGSHLFDISPQELNKIKNLDFNDDNVVLGATKKLNSDSEVVQLNVKDGQFIIFNGKLWHGTKNTTEETRTSILFQYTRPENKVRIPKAFTIPASTWYEKEPMCLLVHGQDKFKVNKLIDFEKISPAKSYLKGLFFYLPANMKRIIKSYIK